MRQGVNGDGVVLSDVFVEHQPVDLLCDDDGMTRQEFADECDINVLMARYETTGVLNHFNMRTPEYLDVSDVPDLQRAMQVLDDAERAFMTLPAIVRREFDQDPLKFMEFCAQKENLDRLREWGLAPPALAEPAGAVSVPPGSGGAGPSPASPRAS